MLHDTLNAIEKEAIAKSVATYIIDHLLVDEPMCRGVGVASC